MGGQSKENKLKDFILTDEYLEYHSKNLGSKKLTGFQKQFYFIIGFVFGFLMSIIYFLIIDLYPGIGFIFRLCFLFIFLFGPSIAHLAKILFIKKMSIIFFEMGVFVGICVAGILLIILL